MTSLPDILEIQPLTKAPNCTITVPGSKSITNRALILAALAPGRCTLRGALWADDTQVMVESLRRLGFGVEVLPDPAEPCNRVIVVGGRDGVIPAKQADLFVGNAGTAARFLTALVTLGHGAYRISGDPRMHERPMGELFRALGITGENLPVTVQASGRRAGRLRVSGHESSQFASALLLTGYEVEAEPHAYVAMTEQVMRDFSSDFTIEPDLSSASYFVATNFLTGGRVQIAGWPTQTLQVDGRLPVFLPPPAVVSRQTDLGDSVMTLVICALFGLHPVRIVEAERLRVQECDRVTALVTELRRVGAKVEEHRDGLTVWPAGPGQLHGAEIETYHDHRMAMCFAVLGLKVPGIRIKNPACVSKTFPNFFDKLEQLRQ